MVLVTSNQRDVILDAVRTMYTAVARRPEQVFHFPTGRAACELVGYPADLLDGVPAAALESFAGVGNPFAAGVARPGDVVLHVGSGSGTDAFIAAGIVGPGGRVHALDMTPAMREKLDAAARASGMRQVTPLAGEAEAIPLPADSVDVVTSNGVLNLVPDKQRAMCEIARVLRPGGRVQIADIVLGRPASEACRDDPQLWAECIVGATVEDAYVALLRRAGLVDIEVLGRHDYFAASPSAETREVAELFGALAVVLRARKPESWAPSEGRDGDDVAPAPPTPSASPLPPGSVRPDRLYDAGSRGCGEVLPLVRDELRRIAVGEVLGVRAEAPEAAVDIEVWARMVGHAFLGRERADAAAHTYFIRRVR